MNEFFCLQSVSTWLKGQESGYEGKQNVGENEEEEHEWGKEWEEEEKEEEWNTPCHMSPLQGYLGSPFVYRCWIH